MSRHGTGGNVQHKRRQLAGQFVQRGYHQQQPLGRGKGGGQRTGLQGTVNGSDRPGFRLHLDHPRCIAPYVVSIVARPGRRVFRHGGTGGNRIDSDNFIGSPGYGGDRVITVGGDHD